MKTVPIALAASAALVAGPAPAQEPGSQPTRAFVQAAAQSDQFEILEAESALAESKSPQIRAFAQQMIEAHQRTSDSLMQAAARAGLKPPLPGISGDQAAFLAALQSQRGADFDRTYLKQQVLAHRAALVVEQAYAASGDDAAIRQVAADTVPIITAHLQMAEQMQAAMGGA